MNCVDSEAMGDDDIFVRKGLLLDEVAYVLGLKLDLGVILMIPNSLDCVPAEVVRQYISRRSSDGHFMLPDNCRERRARA